MSLKAVNDYIRDVSTNLDFSATFFIGQQESLDRIARTKGVVVWLLPPTSSGGVNSNQTFIDTYNLQLAILIQDRMDTGINANKTDQNQKQEETLILEYSDSITNDILRALNDNTINAELERYSSLVTVSSYTKDFAIKDGVHKLSGVLLNLSLQVPDDFDYCC